MKNLTCSATLIGVLLFSTIACQPGSTTTVDSETSTEFKKYLTFYASFDEGTTADVALGDANIYSASSRSNLDEMQAGMNNPNHQLVEGRGRFGSALEFGDKGDAVLFYKSGGNVSYSPDGWSGSISFWLSVDPAIDLGQYSDPIQITDTSYNDASIWVDFTDQDPLDFRLGVIGDREAWNSAGSDEANRAAFERRLVSIKTPLFSRQTWTHVLITHDGLGTDNDAASLYLNGEKLGSIGGIGDPFTWDLEQSKIFLGLNYTGLMDELSIFDKPLTDNQAMELYQLEGGVRSLL